MNVGSCHVRSLAVQGKEEQQDTGNKAGQKESCGRVFHGYAVMYYRVR